MPHPTQPHTTPHHINNVASSADGSPNNVASSADARNKERDQCPTPPHPPKNYESHGVVNSAVSFNNPCALQKGLVSKALEPPIGEDKK